MANQTQTPLLVYTQQCGVSLLSLKQAERCKLFLLVVLIQDYVLIFPIFFFYYNGIARMDAAIAAPI